MSVKYSETVAPNSDGSNFFQTLITYTPLASSPDDFSKFLLTGVTTTVNLGGTSYPTHLIINDVIGNARFSLLNNLYAPKAANVGTCWPQHFFVLLRTDISRERTTPAFLSEFLTDVTTEDSTIKTEGDDINLFRTEVDGFLIKSVDGSPAHSVNYNTGEPKDLPFKIRGPVNAITLSIVYWLDLGRDPIIENTWENPKNNEFYVDFDLVF